VTHFAPQSLRLSDSSALLIRRATPLDAPQLLDHIRQVLQEGDSFVSTLAEFRATEAHYREYIASCMDKNDKLLLLGILDGQLAGLIDFSADARLRAAHTGTFELSVAERFRRRGVGRMLIQALLRWCEESPVLEKVYLAVLSSNVPALSLYQRLGFREEGRLVDAIKLGPAHYCDEVLMGRMVKGESPTPT
jgi:RimJ/RimL family protein N-acetyltransferase